MAKDDAPDANAPLELHFSATRETLQGILNGPWSGVWAAPIWGPCALSLRNCCSTFAFTLIPSPEPLPFPPGGKLNCISVWPPLSPSWRNPAGKQRASLCSGSGRGFAIPHFLMFWNAAERCRCIPTVLQRPWPLPSGGDRPGYYGEERLAQSLARHTDKPDARSQLEGIRADLLAYMVGSEPHDDITLMVYPSPGGRAKTQMPRNWPPWGAYPLTCRQCLKNGQAVRLHKSVFVEASQ